MLQAFAFLVLPGELGLEVCAGKGTSAKEAMKSGMWHPCDPVEGTITVNVGDALQYWSDDRLKSTFHRVRVPKEHEYKVQCPALCLHPCTNASRCFQASMSDRSQVAPHPRLYITKLEGGNREKDIRTGQGAPLQDHQNGVHPCLERPA